MLANLVWEVDYVLEPRDVVLPRARACWNLDARGGGVHVVSEGHRVYATMLWSIPQSLWTKCVSLVYLRACQGKVYGWPCLCMPLASVTMHDPGSHGSVICIFYGCSPVAPINPPFFSKKPPFSVSTWWEHAFWPLIHENPWRLE